MRAGSGVDSPAGNINSVSRTEDGIDHDRHSSAGACSGFNQYWRVGISVPAGRSHFRTCAKVRGRFLTYHSRCAPFRTAPRCPRRRTAPRSGIPSISGHRSWSPEGVSKRGHRHARSWELGIRDSGFREDGNTPSPASRSGSGRFDCSSMIVPCRMQEEKGGASAAARIKHT